MPGVGAGRLAAEPQGLHVPAQGGAPEAGAAFLPVVTIVVARPPASSLGSSLSQPGTQKGLVLGSHS